ncbi:MAG: class I SAM-dependent methyltransferase [Acidobacteriota bacterium]|nr:class I SAM-dependent methyltransferase [Acidobacteriota bacterium]
MTKEKCKICGSSGLTIFAHTARCKNCGVLLYFPYPKDDHALMADGEGKKWQREYVLQWYAEAAFYNHSNFTNMLRFTMDKSFNSKETLDILDYGGGGGQFALVCKSHFPQSNVYITDISDEALLEEWKPLNNQISFREFDRNEKKFDFIFLNDVFEHVSDPMFVLNQLSSKLKKDGKIFIDTPKQFFIYPVGKILSKSIYTKILQGTVSTSHLQIWSKKSFELIVKACNLKIIKYNEVTEYTMPAEFYMKNMNITNPLLKLAGKIFYANAKWLAKNKLIATLTLDKTKPQA